MPCYFPLQATYSLRADGKKDIKFSNANGQLFQLGVKPLGDSNLSLPCGRCMGCRLEKSRQWAVRCVHESKCFDDNCFVTLTFAPEHVPLDGSLRRKHVQDFVKRLRFKYSDRKIRVFYCGEYGEVCANCGLSANGKPSCSCRVYVKALGRPHYHLCLFNFDFVDRKRMYKVNDFWYYRSSDLESLWTFGNSTCCDFSFETAAYVARYCTKKINGSQADSHYGGCTPEFAGMSLKPGIGKTWFDKFAKSDLFPHDNVVSRGARSKPPRYYDVLREREDPVGFAEAKEARRLQGEENADHATCKRLAVRLKCLESRTRLLVRRLENGRSAN